MEDSKKNNLHKLYFLRALLSNSAKTNIYIEEYNDKKNMLSSYNFKKDDSDYKELLNYKKKLKAKLKTQQDNVYHFRLDLRVISGRIEELSRFSLFGKKNRQQLKAIEEKRLKEYSDLLLICEENVKKTTDAISETEEKLNYMIEVEAPQKKLKKEKELENLKEKIIKETKASISLLNSFKKTSIIDERDWGNLDVIIYELETGRADTIKEALQQTDLYIRHNEIVSLIKVATASVCRAIQDSIDELSHSFNREISLLRSDAAELNSNLISMVNAQKLGNALLEKANVSSNEMVKDFARLRQLEEFDFYGIK